MNNERAELIPVMRSQIAHEYKCSNCGEYYIIQTYSLHLPKECKCGCKLDLIQDEWLKELENDRGSE